MHKEIWTIGRILQWTEQYFQSKEMDTPRLDGEAQQNHMVLLVRNLDTDRRLARNRCLDTDVRRCQI